MTCLLMWTALFQIVCLGCEAAALFHLLGVLHDHAGIDWHGAPTVRRMSIGLSLLITVSIVLRFVGFPLTALLVAALPVLLAAGMLGFVLLVSWWK